MRFNLIYKGCIPTQAKPDSIARIRTDEYLQAQLRALYVVTSTAYKTNNKQIVDGELYTAILSVDWVCSAEIVLIRATPLGRINALPDIDNALKTIFDAVCAPGRQPSPPGSSYARELHVIALEDKQLTSISVSSDHHWSGRSEDDLTMIRITTQETPIDDAVALGGQTFASLRREVF